MSEADAHGIEPIARGICIRDGKLLVCRPKGAKTCYLPGGHIEFGETGRAALVRELMEESGRQVTAGSFRGVIEKTFMQYNRPHAEINLLYELELDDDAIQSVEAAISFDWVALGELAAAGLLPVELQRLATDSEVRFEA